MAARARRTTWVVAAGVVVAVLSTAPLWAHTFPERSEPRVGAVIRAAPTQVRIWFDGRLEPAFSQITVTSAAGQRVDHGDPHVDPESRRQLWVTLPSLAPGVYQVQWSVLSVDGHRTDGTFTFTLKLAD